MGWFTLLKKSKLNKIKLLSPSLANPKVFLYFHKKHKNIVPQISAELKKMKADGTTLKIYNEVLKPLLN